MPFEPYHIWRCCWRSSACQDGRYCRPAPSCIA